MSAFLRLQDFTLTLQEQRLLTPLKNALPVITVDLALTKQHQILQQTLTSHLRSCLQTTEVNALLVGIAQQEHPSRLPALLVITAVI